jgi:pimeloyl-ACP methyl ester carboxylesterase
MPIALVNGVRIYYEESGRGRPLVLSHGFACGLRMWDPQVKGLKDRYRVVTYDARGHGASEAPEDVDAYTQDGVVEDLRQLMVHFGLRGACLGGLSMGGRIALELALAHPELLAGLIVADAGSGSDSPEQFRAGTERRASILEQEGIEAGADAMMIEPTFATYAQQGPEAARNIRGMLTTHRAHGLSNSQRGIMAGRSSIYALEERLKALRVPTLVIVGERDEPCLEPSRFMAKAIPQAKLVVIRGVGHMSNLEDSTTFTSVVEEFLTHLWRA